MNGGKNSLPDPVALEEWKLLASIIGRLEEVEYKIRSWLVALITALAVALYSKRLDLSVGSFALIGIILIIIFVWMDLIHRMPKRNAIKRDREIEEILREGRQYDGPKMSMTLAKPRRCGNVTRIMADGLEHSLSPISDPGDSAELGIPFYRMIP